MKEEHAIVLDYLPNGYPFDTRQSHKKSPIAQALGKDHFVLLELIPKKGIDLQVQEEVYIGEGKRLEIYYIFGRLKREKLTEGAKAQLQEFISTIVVEREKQFIDFFNKADAINKRIHQIELLPGLGKKHMQEIIKQRQEKEFQSFEDLKNRVQNLPDPKKAIEKRILKELTELERHNLFTG